MADEPTAFAEGEEPDVHRMLADAGEAAGIAEVQAGGGQVSAAEAASRAVIKAAEDQGALLHELPEVVALAASRAAMHAITVEDPTVTISEIARCLSPDSLQQLKAETRRRTERNNKISPGELKTIFRKIGLDLNDDAWPQVFQELDRDQSGRISYSEFVDSLERAEEECRQAGIAAAMAAGTTIGHAALSAGHSIREAADFAATAASKASSDFGLVPADAAALGGRAAGKLATDTADRVQAADAAAEAAGTFATRVAIDAGLTLEQVAEEATIAACAAAEEAGSTPQHVAEVSAKAAGIAAGEMAADAGNTAMKSAEIAAKAATKSAATSELPPYQAVEATATAAARSASRAAINAGHPYLIIAEVTRQLNTQLVAALKDADNGKDSVSLAELKEIFSRSNIDIHEDTLRQVFEEMGVNPASLISFRSFMDAVEKAHGIFMEAGRAAATVAGRVIGQAAAESGDDPEQAGEVAASAASSAAKTSGLAPAQVAEVAVAAAGNAAASAAIAAGSTPEQVAFLSGQAAVSAARKEDLEATAQPQVVVPIFARAAGRAAAQQPGAGRDTAKVMNRAASAASEAGERLGIFTTQQLAEAAEAASNEASRVLSSGPRPAAAGRGKGAGRGNARTPPSRGRTPGSTPQSTQSLPAPRPKATPKAAPAAKKASAPKPAPKRSASEKSAARPKSKAAADPPSARSGASRERPVDPAVSTRSAESAARSIESGVEPSSASSKARGAKAKAMASGSKDRPAATAADKSPPKAKRETKSDKVPGASGRLPDAGAPRTAEAAAEPPKEAPPSSVTDTKLGQPSPAQAQAGATAGLSAATAQQPPTKPQVIMEPIAGAAQPPNTNFATLPCPCGKSLQVPTTQVTRFFTPYVLTRPASATIPVPTSQGNSLTVAVAPQQQQLSPPTVFRMHTVGEAWRGAPSVAPTYAAPQAASMFPASTSTPGICGTDRSVPRLSEPVAQRMVTEPRVAAEVSDLLPSTSRTAASQPQGCLAVPTATVLPAATTGTAAPSQVARFYTPYMVTRPASAAIPIGTTSQGNSLTVVSQPSQSPPSPQVQPQLSPPTVFRLQTFGDSWRGIPPLPAGAPVFAPPATTAYPAPAPVVAPGFGILNSWPCLCKQLGARQTWPSAG